MRKVPREGQTKAELVGRLQNFAAACHYGSRELAEQEANECRGMLEAYISRYMSVFPLKGDDE
jgi:hypothetical protein